MASAEVGESAAGTVVLGPLIVLELLKQPDSAAPRGADGRRSSISAAFASVQFHRSLVCQISMNPGELEADA
jgi:hypothetical protein